MTVPSPPRAAVSAAVFVVLLAASLFSPALAGAEPSLPEKRAQADRSSGRSPIDAELGHAIEAYNAAEIRLSGIKAEQKVNARRLEIARANFRRAQATLERRLVALYTADEQSALAVLLGASSIEELINRVDAINRVSEQDARIIREVRMFRDEVRTREAELEARSGGAGTRRRRSLRAQGVDREQLAERQQLLSSINDDRRDAGGRGRQQQRLQAQAEHASRLSGGGRRRESAARQLRRRRRHRHAVPRRPVRVGRSLTVRLRLLGLHLYVYAQVGVSLPHNAAMQYGYGSPVSRRTCSRATSSSSTASVTRASTSAATSSSTRPHTGDVVKISSLTGWYDYTYYGARRLSQPLARRVLD